MTPEERPLPLLVAVLATLGVALIGIAIICDVKGVRSIARTKWEKPHGGAEADRYNIVAVVVGVVFAAVGGFLFAAAVDAFLKSLA